MPYIIVVIALVVASVGFTFFESSHTAVSKTPSEPIAIEHSNEVIKDPTSNNVGESSENAIAEIPPIEESPEQTPKTNPTPLPAPEPLPTPKPLPTPAPVNTNTYKNGTYRTQASYRTPGGQYQIDVTLSVFDDKITNTTVSWNAGGNDGYSNSFNRSYQSSVTGQDLGTVHPSRIGGASLTTRAFNSALDTIRSQAT
jgi:hypothetical protein